MSRWWLRVILGVVLLVGLSVSVATRLSTLEPVFRSPAAKPAPSSVQSITPRPTQKTSTPSSHLASPAPILSGHDWVEAEDILSTAADVRHLSAAPAGFQAFAYGQVGKKDADGCAQQIEIQEMHPSGFVVGLAAYSNCEGAQPSIWGKRSGSWQVIATEGVDGYVCEQLMAARVPQNSFTIDCTSDPSMATRADSASTARPASSAKVLRGSTWVDSNHLLRSTVDVHRIKAAPAGFQDYAYAQVGRVDSDGCTYEIVVHDMHPAGFVSGFSGYSDCPFGGWAIWSDRGGSWKILVKGEVDGFLCSDLRRAGVPSGIKCR